MALYKEQAIDKLPLKSDSSAKTTATEGLSMRKLARVFFYLFLFTKPFYLFASGSFQIGDLCLIISFIFLLADERGGFRLDRIDLLLVLFVGFACIVNSVYLCLYSSIDFIRYSSYYIFNVVAVLTFRRLSLDKTFIERCVFVLRVVLAVQFAICVLGLGRDYNETRYMGTFNDPNQLGFFVFASLIFIQIAIRKCEIKSLILDDVFAIYLIVQSASTDMILGLCVLYAVRLYLVGFNGSFTKKLLMVIAALMIVGTTAFVVLPSGHIQSIQTGNGQVDTVIQRVTYKLDKIGNSGASTGYNSSLLVDRGADKLFCYPEKILYGAGEGKWTRFDEAYASNEVHSTVLGLLFYYGIVPFFILAAWVYLNLKPSARAKGILLLYLPLLIECCFLANQRQPLLWIIVVLASVNYLRADAKPESI